MADQSGHSTHVVAMMVGDQDRLRIEPVPFDVIQDRRGVPRVHYRNARWRGPAVDQPDVIIAERAYRGGLQHVRHHIYQVTGDIGTSSHFRRGRKRVF